MKHPYVFLCENVTRYSNILKSEDITQFRPNHFGIEDIDFNLELFLQDYQRESGIVPLEHAYFGSNCLDPLSCHKPYKVFGFDNVLFFVKNKDNY